MKSLIKKFSYNEILALCKEKDWRLPTLEEARTLHSEYNVFWIADLPAKDDERGTYSLIFDRKAQETEKCNKNFMLHCCVVKLNKLSQDEKKTYLSYLKRHGEVKFFKGDHSYHIFDSQNEDGYVVDKYDNDEAEYTDDYECIDGGLCTGSAEDALEFMI